MSLLGSYPQVAMLHNTLYNDSGGAFAAVCPKLLVSLLSPRTLAELFRHPLPSASTASRRGTGRRLGTTPAAAPPPPRTRAKDRHVKERYQGTNQSKLHWAGCKSSSHQEEQATGRFPAMLDRSQAGQQLDSKKLSLCAAEAGC